MASSIRAPTEVYSEINEKDEWAAIQKFNVTLHFEEVKAAQARDAERKRLIREQLAKQVEEREIRKQQALEEEIQYNQQQEQHYEMLEEREK